MLRLDISFTSLKQAQYDNRLYSETGLRGPGTDPPSLGILVLRRPSCLTRLARRTARHRERHARKR